MGKWICGLDTLFHQVLTNLDMCLNNIPAKKLWIEENTILISQVQVKGKIITETTVLSVAQALEQTCTKVKTKTVF